MEEFDIKRFLKTALAKKVYVISIIVVSMIIGIIYTFFLLVPKYKAVTKIVLTQVEGTTASTTESITSSDITLNKNLVSTYGEILKSDKVLSKVINNLELNMTENQLKSIINIVSVNNTEMLDVSVTTEDPALSTTITNELASVFVKEVSELYKINNINIIDEAKIPTGPCNVNHIKDIIVFTFLGVFVAAGFVLLLYMIDTTIKMEEDVEAYTGLTVLTSIPLCESNIVKKGDRVKNNSRTKMSEVNKRRHIELVAYDDPKSTIAETFRTLRANLAFTQTNKRMKNILLTSSEMSEGKSFVSANIAVTFAKADKKVIIVDADMRKGRQHNIFKVVNTQGLSNCLSSLDEDEGSMELESLARYIKTTKVPNLHIMTSGDRPPNPAELVSSHRMVELLKLLNRVYDIVIIDGTPSMIVSDSIILSKFVDTTIVVAACRTTKIEALQKVKKSIENVGGKIAGVILNKVPMSEKAYNKKYYYADAAKEENVQRTKDDIRSVKEILSSAIAEDEMNKEEQAAKNEQNKIEKATFEDMSDDDKHKLIGDYYLADNKLLQYKMETLSNEINSIKTLFLQAMVNNPKQLTESASSEDIAELKKEIKELRQIVESNKAGMITEDIKKEFAEIKNMSEILLESQANNKEKIDKFIENYRLKKLKKDGQ